MNRNWLLIKSLLEHVERHGKTSALSVGIPYPKGLKGAGDEETAYHLTLCQEAGFIVLDEEIRHIRRLTWAGHNKLDELRKSASPIKWYAKVDGRTLGRLTMRH